MQRDATEISLDSIFNSEHDPYVQLYRDFEKSKYRIKGDSAIVGECLAVNTDDKCIIDVGCGLGVLTDRIARECDPKYICGIDISGAAIQRAIELYPEVMFFKKDICDKFFSLDIGLRFNIFLLVNVLQYFVDASIAAKNIFSIADGRFYLLVVDDNMTLIDNLKNELLRLGCDVGIRTAQYGQKYTITVLQCNI